MTAGGALFACAIIALPLIVGAMVEGVVEVV